MNDLIRNQFLFLEGDFPDRVKADGQSASDFLSDLLHDECIYADDIVNACQEDTILLRFRYEDHSNLLKTWQIGLIGTWLVPVRCLALRISGVSGRSIPMIPTEGKEIIKVTLSYSEFLLNFYNSSPLLLIGEGLKYHLHIKRTIFTTRRIVSLGLCELSWQSHPKHVDVAETGSRE